MLVYVQGGSRGQDIVKNSAASPCPMWLDIMVLIFRVNFSARDSLKE